MKFRVLQGSHYEPTAKGLTRFTKGEIVETELDLVAKFGAGKFQRVDAFEQPRRARRKPQPIIEDEEPEPTEEVGDGEPTLTPLHKGGGRWGVYNEDDEKIHDDWLDKEGAFELAGIPLGDDEE